MANPIIELLRRTKLSYLIYNIFHRKYLTHNIPVYKRFGIKKFYFSPIGSHELKGFQKFEKPWLDVKNSWEALPENSDFNLFDESIQKALLPWSDKGFAILQGFFSNEEADNIVAEVDELVANGKANWRYNNSRIMFAIWDSKSLFKLATPKKLENILSFILGKKVKLFQSINFYKGSQQAAHSDSIHMTTFPLGYMIAVWIALEDITLENGPLFYYPESHKLPYVLNRDIKNEGNWWLTGGKSYKVYEEELDKNLKSFKLKKNIFLAKKGDVLIWHANLIHGGEPIINPEFTRKSMVMHYFSEDVVSYHEFTQRPALIRSV